MAAIGIECPICFEPYDANDHVPLMFPECGHSACGACMHNLGKNGAETSTIQCPSDRKTQPLPPRGLDGLSKNFGLLEAINSPTVASPPALPKNDPLCEFCDEEPHPALYKCLECQQVHECMHENVMLALLMGVCYMCLFWPIAFQQNAMICMCRSHATCYFLVCFYQILFCGVCPLSFSPPVYSVLFLYVAFSFLCDLLRFSPPFQDERVVLPCYPLL
jgi:hypothetical protein